MIQQNDVPEFIGQIIDIFEDFLEAHGIDIPNPEKEENPDACILYGTDYGELQTQLEEMMVEWKVIEFPKKDEHPAKKVTPVKGSGFLPSCPNLRWSEASMAYYCWESFDAVSGMDGYTGVCNNCSLLKTKFETK